MSENMTPEERRALLATNTLWFSTDDAHKQAAQRTILEMARTLSELNSKVALSQVADY